MGLDITYHEHSEPISPDNKPGEDVYEWAERVGAFKYFAYECFADRLDGIDEGWMISHGNVSGFCAGSYGGYNHWRSKLARTMLGVSDDDIFADPGKYDGMPFVELINFADNEGCIGPKTSAKLAKDFEEHRDRYHNHPDTDHYDMTKYDEWMMAFQIAADTGCVEFH